MRLDRLGRSLAELPAIAAMLKERGIALLSLEKLIDTGSAAGEPVFHVFGAIARFERRLIAERTKDGIAAARAQGRKPGHRPFDPKQVAGRPNPGPQRPVARQGRAPGGAWPINALPRTRRYARCPSAELLDAVSTTTLS